MNNSINIEFMKKACNLATDSVKKGTGPFGCVIYDPDQNKIYEGHNLVTQNNDPTAHAEIITIRKACNEKKTHTLDSCIIYSSCEPCSMCLSAIYWAKIKKVYYVNSKEDANSIGFKDSYIYKELSKHTNDKNIEIISLVKESNLNEIAKEAFNLWFDKKDKILY